MLIVCKTDLPLMPPDAIHFATELTSSFILLNVLAIW